MKEFSRLFEGVNDPRRSNATRHDLHEMLMIALLCVLCGGEGCHDMSLKFQQIQKYETGTNRISASRMWDIAVVMDVPVSFFFEGLDGQTPDTGAARGDILTDKEALELVRACYSIPENQRRRLFDLARVLSDVA